MTKINREWIEAAVRRHRMSAAIAGIVAIAIVMTLVNMSLYYSGGTAFIDLSRPGLEKERQQVQSNSQKDEKFSNSGAIDEKVLAEFQKQYDKSRGTLNQLGKYDDQGLSDTSFRFTQETETTPSDGAESN